VHADHGGRLRPRAHNEGAEARARIGDGKGKRLLKPIQLSL
jgi:hypothetical protein